MAVMKTPNEAVKATTQQNNGGNAIPRNLLQTLPNHDRVEEKGICATSNIPSWNCKPRQRISLTDDEDEDSTDEESEDNNENGVNAGGVASKDSLDSEDSNDSEESSNSSGSDSDEEPDENGDTSSIENCASGPSMVQLTSAVAQLTAAVAGVVPLARQARAPVTVPSEDFRDSGNFTNAEFQVLHDWRDTFCAQHNMSLAGFQVIMTRAR